jgi:hypothetical protein
MKNGSLQIENIKLALRAGVSGIEDTSLEISHQFPDRRCCLISGPPEDLYALLETLSRKT